MVLPKSGAVRSSELSEAYDRGQKVWESSARQGGLLTGSQTLSLDVQALASTLPSANGGPGFPSSPEPTKLTAESGPAVLPSSIVCKDKRDADGLTLWQGRQALGEDS